MVKRKIEKWTNNDLQNSTRIKPKPDNTMVKRKKTNGQTMIYKTPNNKLKRENTMGKRKKDKGQTMFYKTPHRKLNTENTMVKRKETNEH